MSKHVPRKQVRAPHPPDVSASLAPSSRLGSWRRGWLRALQLVQEQARGRKGPEQGWMSPLVDRRQVYGSGCAHHPKPAVVTTDLLGSA